MLSFEDLRVAIRGEWCGAGRPPDPGAAIAGFSIDTRTLAAGQVFCAILGPHQDGHEFLAQAAERGAAAAVVQREVAAPAGLALLRVANTTQALADAARKARALARIPFVCVTGSTGKTTTKEMAAALCAEHGPVLKTEGNLNNQYGLPLTLLRLTREHTAAVLELGMSAAGELRALAAIARPDVAVITNVAPVHLEFFASLDDIATAKAEIVEGLASGGRAVLNYDDPRLRRLGERMAHRVVWFGRDAGCEVRATRERVEDGCLRFDLQLDGQTLATQLPLVAPHAVMNFLAAAAAAREVGCTAQAIAAAASQMQPARGRGQVLTLREGIRVIDDTYNANPLAVAAAARALSLLAKGRRVACLGDMLELGPAGPSLHREVGGQIAEQVDVLIAVGPLARGFLEGAGDQGLSPNYLHGFPGAAGAAAAVPGLVRPGDTVLIKGSRGMRMEQILEALLATWGPPES